MSFNPINTTTVFANDKILDDLYNKASEEDKPLIKACKLVLKIIGTIVLILSAIGTLLSFFVNSMSKGYMVHG